MRIPAVFGGGPISTTLFVVESDFDFVDETAATAEQRQPEIRERRRPIEQLRLFDVPQNGDALLVLLAAQELIEVIR